MERARDLHHLVHLDRGRQGVVQEAVQLLRRVRRLAPSGKAGRLGPTLRHRRLLLLPLPPWWPPPEVDVESVVVRVYAGVGAGRDVQGGAGDEGQPAQRGVEVAKHGRVARRAAVGLRRPGRAAGHRVVDGLRRARVASRLCQLRPTMRRHGGGG